MTSSFYIDRNKFDKELLNTTLYWICLLGFSVWLVYSVHFRVCFVVCICMLEGKKTIAKKKKDLWPLGKFIYDLRGCHLKDIYKLARGP